MNNFQKWYATSTPEQKKAVAKVMGTSVATVRQAAGAWRSGGVPSTGPEFARKVEESLAALGFGFVSRGELCHACAACDLAAIARKATHKTPE